MDQARTFRDARRYTALEVWLVRAVLGTVILLAFYGLAGAAVPMDYKIPGDSLYRATVMQFYKTYSVNRLSFDGHGLPGRMEGSFSGPLAGRDPVDVVFRFLESNKQVFKMTNPRAEFRVIHEGGLDAMTGTRNVRLQQEYAGLEVKRAFLFADFSREGILHWVRSTYFPITGLASQPSLSLQAAEQVALDLGQVQSDSRRITGSRLLVYVRDSVAHLTWIVGVSPDRLTGWGGYENYIDAHTGEILRQLPMTIGLYAPKFAPKRQDSPVVPEEEPSGTIRIKAPWPLASGRRIEAGDTLWKKKPPIIRILSDESRIFRTDGAGRRAPVLHESGSDAGDDTLQRGGVPPDAAAPDPQSPVGLRPWRGLDTVRIDSSLRRRRSGDVLSPYHRGRAAETVKAAASSWIQIMTEDFDGPEFPAGLWQS